MLTAESPSPHLLSPPPPPPPQLGWIMVNQCPQKGRLSCAYRWKYQVLITLPPCLYGSVDATKEDGLRLPLNPKWGSHHSPQLGMGVASYYGADTLQAAVQPWITIYQPRPKRKIRSTHNRHRHTSQRGFPARSHTLINAENCSAPPQKG